MIQLNNSMSYLDIIDIEFLIRLPNNFPVVFLTDAQIIDVYIVKLDVLL